MIRQPVIKRCYFSRERDHVAAQESTGADSYVATVLRSTEKKSDCCHMIEITRLSCDLSFMSDNNSNNSSAAALSNAFTQIYRLKDVSSEAVFRGSCFDELFWQSF